MIDIYDGPDIPNTLEERIDISKYDIGEVCQRLNVRTPRLPHPKSKIQTRFIRSIPLSWAQQAAQLPGKALHVGCVLWYWSGITKSETVALTRTRLRQFGLNHETGRRGLIALEEANLVSVERSGRKSSRVTLLEILGLSGN